MIRYTSFAGSIGRITSLPWAYSIQVAKRVPKPVRELFSGPICGGLEVDWDPKTRTATRVPIWERRHL